MSTTPSPSPVRKQAVLVIHGIGSQRPMETLGTFVDQVWNGPKNTIWYKPDTRARNFDLSQIVAMKGDTRTDFYELYWAHLMEGTRFYSVWAWFLHNLLKRKTSEMPAPMQEAKRLVAVLLWGLLLTYSAAVILLACHVLAGSMSAYANVACGVAAGLTLVSVLARWWRTATISALYAVAFYDPSVVGRWTMSDYAVPGAIALVLVLTTALALLDRRVISPIIGDAARYLRNDPDNIAARQKIRALGVDALERLHGSERDYERIIVVGHSLGSIIGYDILRYAFARRMQEFKLEMDGRPTEIEAFDAACGKPGTAAYRDAQHALCRVVGGTKTDIGPAQQSEKAWIVTDFVTLGSPLAYANVLMAGSSALKAASNDDFDKRKRTRLLPTNPPALSTAPNEAGIRGFYAWTESGKDWLQPHHGAVFAFTRWTNLFFPARHVIFGDIIGGPVAPQLGCGVTDVAVHTKHLWGRGFFSHTSYWSAGGLLGYPAAVDAVRLALNLDRDDTAASLPVDTIKGPQRNSDATPP